MRWIATVLALGLLVTAGCQRGASPDPLAGLAPGVYALGDASALILVLERLERLHGTPVAREAAALRSRLDDCDEFVGASAESSWSGLVAAVHCRRAEPQAPEAASAMATLAGLRANDSLAFALVFETGTRIAGTARVDGAGNVEVDARVAHARESMLASLLIPSERSAGAHRLNAEAALLHARLRPSAGLDLASWIGAGAQADELFRLRSDLFAGVVLDGSWEIALYTPLPGHSTPRAALALGVSQRALAEVALDGFVSELESTWSVRHSPIPLASLGPRVANPARAACFLELRVLPQLAPCWVLAGDTLALAWNPASLQHALLAPPSGEGPRDGLRLDLAGVADADQRLRAALVSDAPAAVSDYGWRSLEVRVARDREAGGDATRIRARLVAGGAT